MKPGFALILSPDGISLLLRANQGWRVVGDVPLTTADLNAELQQLRKTAAGLRAGGVACKLVLPASQVLYTKLSAPGPSEAERLVQIRQGLDGLTPYDVDELAFDWRIDGDVVSVAAVAQETLTEAEEFALEHRFNPASFVGMPDKDIFDGEPFFGAAHSLQDWLDKDDPLERDADCISILGAVLPQVGDETSKGKIQTTRPTPSKDVEPPLVPSPTPANLKKQSSEPAAQHVTASTAIAKKPEIQTQLPVSALKETKTTAQTPKTDPPQDDTTDKLPLPAFTSARKNDTKTDQTAASKTHASPALGSALQRQAARFTVAPSPSAGPSKKKAPVASETSSTSGNDDLIDVRAAAASLNPGFSEEIPPPLSKKPRRMRRRKKNTLADPVKKTPVVTSGARSAGPASSAHKSVAVPAPLRPSAGLNEADALTVFGARTPPSDNLPPTAAKPKRGMIITLALIAGLALVLIGSLMVLKKTNPQAVQTESQTTATPSDTAQIQRPAPDDPTDETQDQAEPSSPETTASASIEVTSQSPEIAVQVDAAEFGTGGFDTASLDTSLPNVPAPVETGAASVSALRNDAGANADPISAAVALPENTPDIDRASTDPVSLLDQAPHSLTTAPGQLSAPLSGETTSLYIASIDQASTSHDAVALPEMDIFATDLPLVARLNPAPADSEFVLDKDGLVTPSQNGTLNPDGIRIFAGPPPSVPALRRIADSPEIASDAEKRAANLAANRPKSRPDDLLETNERFRLGGRSKEQLAALTPHLRPESQQQAASPTNADPTDLATVKSPIPKSRPANFAAIVAAAQAKKASQTSDSVASVASVASAPQSVAPSIPSSASVARQATVENAINLRKINLIGVYGSPSNRRALVRLSNGRYVKVKIGDRVDGGKVAAIDQSELRYVKSGRNITLKMPKS